MDNSKKSFFMCRKLQEYRYNFMHRIISVEKLESHFFSIYPRPTKKSGEKCAIRANGYKAASYSVPVTKQSGTLNSLVKQKLQRKKKLKIWGKGVNG